MVSEHEPEHRRGTVTDVDERPAPATTDEDDRERFAHIVWARGRNAEAVILEARVTGTPVTALCGKRWVPSRDPQRFPLCPTCKEIRDRARPRRGDEGGAQ